MKSDEKLIKVCDGVYPTKKTTIKIACKGQNCREHEENEPNFL